MLGILEHSCLIEACLRLSQSIAQSSQHWTEVGFYSGAESGRNSLRTSVARGKKSEERVLSKASSRGHKLATWSAPCCSFTIVSSASNVNCKVVAASSATSKFACIMERLWQSIYDYDSVSP